MTIFFRCRPVGAQTSRPAETAAPRIVNVYNFIRNSDFRVPQSQDVLLDCTRQQIALFKHAGLPATWALQYDALINPRYQKLLKEDAGKDDEIAAWWEIPRPLAEKAGLKWRGRWDWDSASDVGFSPGYTPAERRKLVDVYMADFKAVFGTYPRSVGSWYIDEVTLSYMADQYGIVASCNCKDQVGTDGYTLWGGYWNQAYYPSRLNAYMPAQTRKGQIDVPVFRMLGSDPIYQFGRVNGMYTLEPVYPRAGGSGEWVSWFMDVQTRQPCLGFGYTQAGQENSFGWEAMKKGLTLQSELLAKQLKAGEIRVMTLARAGDWFRHTYPLTPATCVVAIDDWKKQGHKSIWYDSRFYRTNIYWNDDVLYIRDLHLFDERMVSVTHDVPLTKSSLAYGTLPVMDAAMWSEKKLPAGMFPVLISAAGEKSAMVPQGSPVVKEQSASELAITQPLVGGGSIKILCKESGLSLTAVDGQMKPMAWAFDLIGGSQARAVDSVSNDTISYHFEETKYHLKMSAGTCRKLSDGSTRATPDPAGQIRFNFASDQ